MLKRKPWASHFCFGVLTGIGVSCVYLVLLFSEQENSQKSWWDIRVEEMKDKSNEKLNLFVGVDSNRADSTPLTVPNEATTGDLETNPRTNYSYVKKGEEVAKEFASNVRILCWVATIPKHHLTKAAVIRDTWGRRCNVLLFMSSAQDSSLPAVSINVTEGRSFLFHKTIEAMKYVYRHYLNTIDWILKSDDDTFVVVENLRYILSNYDPSEPLYLGCRFRPFTKQGFMSGGAGYVLSRKALKALVEEGIETGKCLKIKNNDNGEDVRLGRCLEEIKVTAVDTRDNLGRGRFFPYSPEFHLFPDHSSPVYQWYWNYQYYPDLEGLNCCSDTAVSFHYIGPNQLHYLDYLIYTLQPYGTSLYILNTSSITIIV